jgi:oxygen-independent coproporphyrinogen-3 oxidase
MTSQRTRTIPLELLRKYDQTGPRYTSYPTAMEFSESFGEREYLAQLDLVAAAENEPISLYVHLPFCAERCSFCGCLVVITKKHDIASRYLDHLHREIEMLAKRLGGRRRLVQYQWGGGTPTYLDLGEMAALHETVTRHFEIDPAAEVAIEVDPRVTTREQIDLLRRLGFNRLSMGVQDFTPEVQEAIGRGQGEGQTRELYAYARAAGFESINIDLVYGLPLQEVSTFRKTLASVIELRPDRLAVYSFAHVPRIRTNQKKIHSEDLPSAPLKFELYGEATSALVAAGYRQIGMDHFALPGDELALAAASGTVHRNFMGYTTKPASDMVGVGLSAIGDVHSAFSQNVKKLTTYFATIESGAFPVERGYVLDLDDRIRRYAITRLMCNLVLERAEMEERFGISFDDYFRTELAELGRTNGPVDDGLLEIHPDRLLVTSEGRLFLRNICMTFDRYLRERSPAEPVFSRTI